MAGRSIYIRKNVMQRLLKLAREAGYVKRDGRIAWQSFMNDLLEKAIALYEMGYIDIRKKH